MFLETIETIKKRDQYISANTNWDELLWTCGKCGRKNSIHKETKCPRCGTAKTKDSITKDQNGYVAFYKNRRIERKCYADTKYEAQLKAAKEFGAKKAYEVTVELAEKDGKQVVHRAVDLDVFQTHQKKIAIKTLQMNDVGVSVMGGMTKAQARSFLKSIGYSDAKIKDIEDGKTRDSKTKK